VGPTGEGFRSAAAREAPAEALQPFYDQTIEWSGCGSGNQCGTITVPLDYANPAGATVELALLKAPATGSDPRGPLVVNPGGPGGSGVEYAEAADLVVSPELRAAFDIVGFDPRGVGASDPLTCLTGPQLDDFLAADGSPDTLEETESLVTESQDFGQGCMDDSPELTALMASEWVVRDMDILRAALNQNTLDYLGFSYGTLLGAMYADEFTDRVGRFVLDGAIDPTLSNTEISKGQALGFEVATRRYIEDCIRQGDCPLGDDPDRAMTTLLEFLSAVDANPLPTGDPDRPLTESLAISAIIYPLYQPEYGWPLLTTSLTLALAGDGSSMLNTVDIFNDRNDDGSYNGNGLDALYAVNCLDRPDRPDLAETEALAQQWSVEAPLYGAYLAYGNLPCTYWPVPATDEPAATIAAGSPEILVIGTEYDPATPYVWAQALAEQLDNGVLVSWLGGDGHTAYNNGSACIDQTVDEFLIDGVVPPNGTECD
jgi:pimeloyl-ACP methyl ester carboxylesterase